jgi:hypothetical protein
MSVLVSDEFIVSDECKMSTWIILHSHIHIVFSFILINRTTEYKLKNMNILIIFFLRSVTRAGVNLSPLSYENRFYV